MLCGMDSARIQLLAARHARELEGTARSLERAAIAEELARVRRGVYLGSETWRSLSDVERHAVQMDAARLVARGEPVFSHESAAVRLGIPVLGALPERVRVVVPPGRSRSSGAVQRLKRTLAEGEVVELDDGMRVTSPARTAVELAASRSLLTGIIAISHVRNRFGTPVAELAAVVRALGASAGVPRARIALERSSDGSESPLESLVVARCHDLGFALPEQQVVVRGIDGARYRIDFSWREGRVLGEADGRAKYFDPAIRGRSEADEVLWREKAREDAVRPLCERFLRVTWSEAWDGAMLERRLTAADVPRDRARRRRPLTF